MHSDRVRRRSYYSAIRKAQRLEKRKDTGGLVSDSGISDGISDGNPTPPQGNSPETHVKVSLRPSHLHVHSVASLQASAPCLALAR